MQGPLPNRRGFLAAALAAVAWTACAPASLPRRRAPAAAPEHATLDAVLAHLLPSEPDAPGAADIRAGHYLRAVLALPALDADERDFVLEGARRVEALAADRAGAGVGFAALAEADREAVLRALEGEDRGAAWLDELLAFLMEALLGDPFHGGNPGGVGWTWLGVDPGFPIRGA